MTDLQADAIQARKLIALCERDLRRTLSAGERRDLLADNTAWSMDHIRGVVALVELLRPAGVTYR